MVDRVRRMMVVKRPRIVGPITVGHGINEFFSIVIPPIIPILVADFGLTYAQAGFLLTIFFISYSIFQLPAGIIADFVGKKILLIVGLIGMSGGILLASVALSYEWLLVAQAMAGISGSTFHPTGMSIISDVEASTTEGKAMGVFGFGGAIGTMCSPLIVGGLAYFAGWRVALGGAAILGIIVTVALYPWFGDPDETETNRDSKYEQYETDGGSSDLLSMGKQLINIPLSSGFALLFLVTLTISLQHRAIQTFTTAYITAETGASISFGNFAFFALLFAGSVSSLWAGDLADRFNRELLGLGTAIATGVLVGATVFLTVILNWMPLVLLYILLAIWFSAIGFMMYASYPIKNALVSEQAKKGFSGSLFGVIQTASALGSATGPALFGILATKWGVVAAFPAIAGVSMFLAVLFVLLLYVK